MNEILNEIRRLIRESRTMYLPHVKAEALEENGAVYYMNGKNGTEFDWYVNGKVSDFFVFYKDENNLVAIEDMFDDMNITHFKRKCKLKSKKK